MYLDLLNKPNYANLAIDSGDDRRMAEQTQVTRNYWIARAFVAIGLLVYAAMPGWSDVVETKAGAILTVEAGFFCLENPDDTVTAPRSQTGKLNIFNSPFAFVHLGDNVPSVPGIGIGVVIKMNDYTDGEILTVREQNVSAGTPPDYWEATPQKNGVTWMGYLGDTDRPYPQGTWLFQIFRNKDLLLSYQFSVLSPGKLPKLRHLCDGLIS